MDIRNKKIIIIVILLIIIAICVFLYFNYTDNEFSKFDNEFLESNIILAETNENIIENVEEQVLEKMIIIHITGEINNKGVIYISKDSRIIDAINMAGGITENADLSKVNLAYKLEDGMKIYIPSIYDKDEIEYISQKSGDNVVIDIGNKNVSDNGGNIMVNINTADEEEFKKLPGIGSSIAIKIVSYRNENGRFKSIEDIKNVSGIGDAKFNNIKNYICV